MCRELSFLVSPNRAVNLSCFFTSPPLTNITKKTGFPPGLCLYHCKLFKVLEELQYVVKFSPSCRSRNWGICFICCPFTSVQKKNNRRLQRKSGQISILWATMVSLILLLYFSYSFFPPQPLLSSFFFVFLFCFTNFLLSIRKSHSCKCMQVLFHNVEFSRSNQRNLKLTWYVHP